MKPPFLRARRVLGALALLAATAARAQEITPVWVQHLNLPTNALPILRRGDSPTELADGTSGFDAYAAFVRYDATRLLLGIRENGINESTASAADRALAAQYPDRSIVWINPTNGAPMGVAHKVPVFPVTLAPDTQGSPNDFFWNWGIEDGPGDSRAIYTTYKHHILRWAPLPGGGWSTNATPAWIEPVPNEPTGDGSSGGDGSASWRWRTFRVTGSGANTVIYAGGATWRQSMHVQKLVTANGTTFTPAARVNDRDGGIKMRYSFSGMNTKVAKWTKDPTRPNLELFYTPSFPASGRELKPRRFSRNPDSTVAGSFTELIDGQAQFNRNNFFDPDSAATNGLPGFVWEGPERPFPSGTDFYDGNWSFAMDAATGLDYIVNYSGPSWNNQYGPNERRPGWLGIHRPSGRIASGASSYKLDFNEVTEVTLDNVNTGNSYTYDGNVAVYADPASPANVQKSEVLWAGGSFGFGVFTVQNTPATLLGSPTNLTVAAGGTATFVANVTGSPNDFRWHRNGVPLPESSYATGTDKVALTLTGVTPGDAGQYQLKWTNPLSGAGETLAATLTVTGTHTRWAGAADIGTVDRPTPTPGEVITNANSFTLRGSGYAAFDTAADQGDTLFFRHENVTGDFDKRVRLVSLTTDPVADPAEPLARAGLMLRQSTNANTTTLEIFAANPAGDNVVRVAGRGRVDQIYARRLSRNYPGVVDTLPNQWLRIKRAGHWFGFYVSTNGTSWSLVSQQYQKFPETVQFGVFTAPDNAAGSSVAVAEFAGYGDTPVSDTTAPTLVSVGTLDKKIVGVKFSEAVNSLSALSPARYSLSQGTVYDVQPGLGANTVHLKVTGLSNDTFTVTVNGGVVDSAGNPVAAGSSAAGSVSAWTSTDIGFVQNRTARPTAGDDPYVTGQAVAISSGASGPEVEIIGGGSNAYNPGDFMHYLYRQYPAGDFDVCVSVERFDKRGIAGGYANGGIHVRSALFLADPSTITEGPAAADNTKVPAYVNIVYYEASDPNRAAIELNRPNPGDGYGNNTPNSNTEEIDGLTGWYPELRAINAAGVLSPTSSPDQSHWLRVKRVGNAFTSFFSYDGVTWKEQDQGNRVMSNLAGPVLIGFGHHNDTGFGAPPENNTYAGNGTTTQNESNYGIVRLGYLGSFPPPSGGDAPTLSIVESAGGTLTIAWQGTGYTLQSTPTVNTGWGPSGLTVITDGSSNTATVTPGAGPLFYRLVR
ncbi:MAG: Ig-like domain-containing protein [Limisphaerales bacterium]